jgi:hypothetical protein
VKKIVLSKHALDKIKILKDHKLFINEIIIKKAIREPDKVEEGYKGRMIAQKSLDDRLILRIVYEECPEELKVITMYPGRRSRYEKD